MTVPMPGQHQVISGATSAWQWMTAYKEIADKLQDMVSSMPSEPPEHAVKHDGAPEIKRARTLPMTYAISLSAAIKKFDIQSGQEDFLKAKRIFGIN